MIQKKFDELSPYLRGIKKADNYSIIETHLKSTWLIPTSDTIQVEKKPTKQANISYYMFYSEIPIDDILQWLEFEVINMNVEIEKKETLLKEKVEQLKNLFETSSLDDLENLQFTSETDVLKLNGSSTKKPEKQEK